MAELYEKLLSNYYGDLGSLEADLASDVAIHENILDDAKRHSSISSKWNCLKAIAETNYRKQKRIVKELVWPAACLAAAERAREAGMKAPQYQIEWSALQDPAYVSAAEIQTKYGHVLDLIKGVQGSLWDKRNMISVLAADENRERYATPKIPSQPEAPWSPKNLGLTEEEMEAAARDRIAQSKSRYADSYRT